MPNGPRAVGIALLSALAASQAALVVLNPLLPDVARDLHVSVATAGQLRTVSGLAAGAAALATGFLAARVGLRGLMLGALVILAFGSLVSALAPDFAVLAVAQVLVGVGIGVSYSAAIAATAEWSTEANRSRVLALTLLGPPLAWIVGMPLVGILGELDWRIGWLVVPVAMALVAAALLLRQPATPPASARAGLRSVLAYPGVARWTTGELFAFSGWAGALVYMGALLVESYDLSIAATGLALGFGALVYVPGNFLFRRWVDGHSRSPARRAGPGRRGHGRGSRCVSTVGLGQRGALRRPLLHRRWPNACRERAWARARSGASAGSDRCPRCRHPGGLLRGSGSRWRRTRGRRLWDTRARVCSALRGSGRPAPRASTLTAVSFEETIRAREGFLSPFAVRSLETRGRELPEDPCEVRTEFQRDRDRIVHSKPFRRLKGKTQVFIDPEGDHYRTRMTHTLETTAISRVVARALRLNEDLVEAIGLGHDMGHTPFGHAGEDALDAAVQERFDRRFRHNEQSLRIARSLNLTLEVCDGILTHTGEREPETLEGKIVRLVDRVAYINHDIDDAVRYGLLAEDDLPHEEIADPRRQRVEANRPLVHDIVESSEGVDDIRQSAEVGEAMLVVAGVHVRARVPRAAGGARAREGARGHPRRSSTTWPSVATTPTRSSTTSPA